MYPVMQVFAIAGDPSEFLSLKMRPLLYVLGANAKYYHARASVVGYCGSRAGSPALSLLPELLAGPIPTLYY